MKLWDGTMYAQDCSTQEARTAPLWVHTFVPGSKSGFEWLCVCYGPPAPSGMTIPFSWQILADFKFSREDAPDEEFALVKELVLLKVEQWRRSLP